MQIDMTISTSQQFVIASLITGAQAFIIVFTVIKILFFVSVGKDSKFVLILNNLMDNY